MEQVEVSNVLNKLPLSFHCSVLNRKRHSSAESRFFQLKQRHIQQGPYDKILNFISAYFHSAYSYTLRLIHA